MESLQSFAYKAPCPSAKRGNRLIERSVAQGHGPGAAEPGFVPKVRVHTLDHHILQELKELCRERDTSLSETHRQPKGYSQALQETGFSGAEAVLSLSPTGQVVSHIDCGVSLSLCRGNACIPTSCRDCGFSCLGDCGGCQVLSWKQM